MVNSIARVFHCVGHFDTIPLHDCVNDGKNRPRIWFGGDSGSFFGGKKVSECRIWSELLGIGWNWIQVRLEIGVRSCHLSFAEGVVPGAEPGICKLAHSLNDHKTANDVV